MAWIGHRAFDLVVVGFQPRDVGRVGQDRFRELQEDLGVLALRVQRVQIGTRELIVPVEAEADRSR